MLRGLRWSQKAECALVHAAGPLVVPKRRSAPSHAPGPRRSKSGRRPLAHAAGASVEGGPLAYVAGASGVLKGERPLGACDGGFDRAAGPPKSPWGWAPEIAVGLGPSIRRGAGPLISPRGCAPEIAVGLGPFDRRGAWALKLPWV